MVTLMEIKQGEHVDVIDFLQMKGLHCGNESTGYFRKANYDELPAACFKYVHVSIFKTRYLEEKIILTRRNKKYNKEFNFVSLCSSQYACM